MINNLDIDSVSGYLTHTPYWIGLCHVQGYLRGWSDDFWPLGPLADAGMFLRTRQDISFFLSQWVGDRGSGATPRL